MAIARGLSRGEAQHLSAVLNRHGVASSVVADGVSEHGFQLEIAESAVAGAIEALRELPAETPGPAACEPSPALLPTPQAERALREHTLNARLQTALERAPGVERATVRVSLPAPESALDDLLEPTEAAPSVSVTVVRAPGETLDVTPLRALVAAAVPGVTAAGVELLEQASVVHDTPCAALSHVGPVTVTADSLGTLKRWLAASLLLHALCGLALLALLRRQRA
ncbi:MAG: hypothetical protein ABW321_30690 [Polyangiales bacterium]